MIVVSNARSVTGNACAQPWKELAQTFASPNYANLARICQRSVTA
ncbi:hypothetical protein UCMB321_3471 [Pseudomonas batumici]|uniref:Uncharacterized protein n=1 Tax=Pseudomonas batumici TaxID=226910 RepID=A0A0C2EA23_9PSED|nr:hypothetical protein UCMB321_3471 [Pseudomonas batumici]